MVSNAELQTQMKTFSTRFEDAMKTLTETTQATKTDLGQKFDDLNARLDGYDTKLRHLESSITHTDNRLGDLSTQILNSEDSVNRKFNALNVRIEELEGKIAKLEGMQKKVESLPDKVSQLAENVEDRTNRQLRETLVFRNIPEEEADESYKQTKELLARIISNNVSEISYQEAFGQIKRAHRERKRNAEEVYQSREGKRHIFAAFHGWDICQQIIEAFRQKCISDQSFNIAADQKYGPITTKRRHLAFQERKLMKEWGLIVSGYVDFPAKLMVNLPGNLNNQGKKIYTMHKNFSRSPVEIPSYANNSQDRR